MQVSAGSNHTVLCCCEATVKLSQLVCANPPVLPEDSRAEQGPDHVGSMCVQLFGVPAEPGDTVSSAGTSWDALCLPAGNGDSQWWQGVDRSGPGHGAQAHGAPGQVSWLGHTANLHFSL